jgi:hypothetical protein
LTAYAPDDLATPLWRLELAWIGGFETHNAVTGTWWVQTVDGWIDPATGQDLPFGEDAVARRDPGDEDAEYESLPSYMLANGDQDVLLRFDDAEDQLMRVNPETSELMWTAPLHVGRDFGGDAYVAGDYLALIETHINFDPRGEDGLNLPNTIGVRVADARTGELLWGQEDLGDLNLVEDATPGCLVLSGDDNAVCLDWATGAATGSYLLGEGCFHLDAGRRILYFPDEAGRLTALDTEDKLAELWSLQLPVPTGAPCDDVYTRLMWNSQRLFAQTGCGGEHILTELKG